MNTLKKTLFLVLLATLPMLMQAQGISIQQKNEIVEIENDDGDVSLVVFSIDEEGQKEYYLSVGTLGLGTDFLQVQFDPVFELFIPLGSSLDEAIQTLQTMKTWYKMPRKSVNMTTGCLALALPNGKFEPVTVITRRFTVFRRLEFRMELGNLYRATYVSRSDYNSMLTSIKLYRKIHPKEL